MKIINETGLTFDDVLLVPRKSTIKSRFGNEIDLSVEILPGIKISHPIISANMDTISENSLVEKIQQLGGLGIIHRFLDIKEHKRQLELLSGYKIGCIGLGEEGRKRANEIAPLCDGILIDVAYGNHVAVFNQIKWLKDSFGIPVIAGNVATGDGVENLVKAGADCIKFGVGNGSLCSTRIKTGNGVPQLTALMNGRKALYDLVEMGIFKESGWIPTLIGDGGIKNSGDIVKALVGGADCVMVGGAFAGTDEAPGDVIVGPNSVRMKQYRGMASKEAQESWKGRATSVEGEATWIPYQGGLENIYNDLISGILSGMSYQDARTICELRKNAVFIRQTSAGLYESKPHKLFSK